MPTTKIATCLLEPGSDISDPKNDAYIALQKTFDIVTQQPGLRQYHLGIQVKNPHMLEAMTIWDTLQNHEYGSARDICHSIVAGGKEMYHVDFEPYNASLAAFFAPITYINRFYFSTFPPAEFLQGFRETVKILLQELVPGLLGAATGVTHEELEFEYETKDSGNAGDKGKERAVVLVMGWESEESYNEFKKSKRWGIMMQLKEQAAVGWEERAMRFVMSGGKELGR